MSDLMKTNREDRGLTQHEPAARAGRRQQLAQRRYPHHV
jgi:hypothetical protein